MSKSFFPEHILNPKLPREPVPGITWPIHKKPLNKKLCAAFHPLISHWFTQMQIKEEKDHIILISCCKFNMEWVRDHYHETIQKVLKEKPIKYAYI